MRFSRRSLLWSLGACGVFLAAMHLARELVFEHVSAQPVTTVRYIALGGGSSPHTTEVSLEQHLLLAQRVLPGPGVTLFGGGTGKTRVRVLDDAAPRKELLLRLGELFQPRAGRDSAYRASTLEARPATRKRFEATFTHALQAGTDPLLLFIATHGEQGHARRDNFVPLWGGGALSAARLGQLHDAHPRPLRVVATGCFSGGFAELAFRGCDAGRGPTKAPRCGLFAGTWDRETSGCDPNPDRRAQEGYSLHFLNALSARDRDGNALPVGRLDLDGDDKVSLLEAHARARVHSRSIDVPTTTSERYLRETGVAPASPEPELLPEEHAVVEGLEARLGLAGGEAAARHWGRLDAQLAEIDRELEQVEQASEEDYAALSTRLLSRWPVLDDPYHPDFATTVRRQGAAIRSALDTWPEAEAYTAKLGKISELNERYLELLVSEASVARLLRARETLELAAGLRKAGGPEYRHYRDLLRCERYVVQ